MKPFLRWAGGKSWILNHLEEILEGRSFTGYHEPFLGGGAVFFQLEKFKRTHLSDLNGNLISTYLQVRDNPHEVISVLETFKNTREFYNSIRQMRFDDEAKRAAQFIYLNQTSFNGIYRENLNGVYNVPYGNRTKDFVQSELLLAASEKLANTNLRTHAFDRHLNFIRPGDLVFLDPPYTITHNNNGFIKYNKNLFALEDQKRLAQFIERIIKKGAYYILTNAAHEEIRTIFSQNAPIELCRQSLVGGKLAKRGLYSEFLFTNIA